jgi:hypothetical protein
MNAKREHLGATRARQALGTVCLALAVWLPSPVSAQSGMMDQLSSTVRSRCKLDGWQVALHQDARHFVQTPEAVRVELSPTLSQGDVICVYQVLADWKVTLAAPAPVMVSPNSNTHCDGSQQPPASSTVTPRR